MESERASYERDVARIGSRGELLELLMNDPWFAWLRELSALVAYIDETLAAEQPATAAEVERLIRRARGLLVPVEEGTGFERHYFQALQRDPNVVLAHAQAKRLIAGLG
ncbi:MAG: hypothetical protein FJW37_00470 [Acidobacteria bacterium]|nr:hypothetical protein [Acidobacteriota bacterium]